MSIEIIAEIGINHMGNMSIARKLIAEAAEAGCSMAKFQWYNTFSLFGDITKDTYNKEIYENVKSFELDEKKIEQLMKWCDLEGIEFGCSIFDEERFLKLDAMGVKKHKLASRVSKFDRALAEKVLDTGKITYTSLGFGAKPFDTKKYPNCKHLYCVANYPTEYRDLDLPKSFGDSPYYGFSSHAMTIYPCLVAISRGAKCIEVHFTMDRGMSALPGGYDHVCSVNKNELSQISLFAKEVEKMNL